MSKFCGGCGAALGSDVRFCESCGKPVAPPAGPAATPAPPQRPPEFTAPTASKRPLIAAGIVLGGLVVLIVIAGAVQSVLFSPKATVQAYFADLADGDATGAKSRLDNVPSDGELLSDKVLSAKSYVAPTDVEVTEEKSDDREDDEREMRVSYVLDGQRKTARLSLDRDDERTLLFFRKWHIDDGTVPLSMPAGVPYQVNGVAIKESSQPTDEPASDSVVTVSFVLFPGRYDVGVAENPLLSGEARKVTLALDAEPAQLSLSTTIKEEAKAEVTKQVKAYVDECAKQTVLQPENCPLNTYGNSGATNVKWSVVTYPTITFKQTPGGSVYVETIDDQQGHASVSYEYQTYDGSYESSNGFSAISVGGPVVVKDGKIDWRSPKDLAEENEGGD